MTSYLRRDAQRIFASRLQDPWFTAAEIASLWLPCLPRDSRSVRAHATAERWTERTAPDGSPLARKRSARGGGTEYHASLFPLEAIDILIRKRSVAKSARASIRYALGTLDPGDRHRLLLELLSGELSA